MYILDLNDESQIFGIFLQAKEKSGAQQLYVLRLANEHHTW